MWADWANRRTAIFSAALIAGALALPVTPAAAQSFAAQPQYAPQADEQPGDDANLSASLRRQVVSYPTSEPAGTIIIDTPHTYLYLTLGGGKALRYGIGVGRQGFTWSGTERIVRKAEWPDWIPPVEMVARQPYLPRFVAGGPGNPLGARAMYLGNTDYRIHGTNDPSSIGKHMSSGCIRLLNADVKDLYSRVGVGTKVIVLPSDQRQAAIGDDGDDGQIAGRDVAQVSPGAPPPGFRRAGIY
ncbi:MAG TPA: L,D-transpeptidase [Xanthobacteraceae bacterium]|nr:L,D-transpeptidase [Xanthobacteraceae bacterium]